MRGHIWCISPWVIQRKGAKTYRHPLVMDALDPGTPDGVDPETREVFPAHVTMRCFPSDPRNLEADHSQVVCLVSAIDFSAVKALAGVKIIGREHLDEKAYIASTPRKEGWTTEERLIEAKIVSPDALIKDIINEQIRKADPKRELK